MTTFFAFLHHLFAFILVAALAVEFILIGQAKSEALSLPIARRLAAADAVLGVSATLLLIVGLLRVFYFEKGAAYYFHSHAFLTKLTLFIVVAVFSLVPTFEFLSWRRALSEGRTPVVAARKMRTMRMIIHAELAAVVVILLCAAIMARGGWI